MLTLTEQSTKINSSLPNKPIVSLRSLLDQSLQVGEPAQRAASLFQPDLRLDLGSQQTILPEAIATNTHSRFTN